MRGRVSLETGVVAVLFVVCGLLVVIAHAQQDNFFSEWRPNRSMHAEFTVHWIRIAKPNEPTPR